MYDNHTSIPYILIVQSTQLESDHMTLQVFLSIKGIYYQADIHGQTVTWITPYQFSQEVSQLWFTR